MNFIHLDGFIMKFILALFLFPGQGDKALQEKSFTDIGDNSAQVGLDFQEKKDPKLETISGVMKNILVFKLDTS